MPEKSHSSEGNADSKEHLQVIEMLVKRAKRVSFENAPCFEPLLSHDFVYGAKKDMAIRGENTKQKSIIKGHQNRKFTSSRRDHDRMIVTEGKQWNESMHTLVEHILHTRERIVTLKSLKFPELTEHFESIWALKQLQTLESRRLMLWTLQIRALLCATYQASLSARLEEGIVSPPEKPDPNDPQAKTRKALIQLRIGAVSMDMLRKINMKKIED
jgi:hypothetical protein